MGRLRSLLRRAAKPSAFALVAGVMSLSLVVTTPTNAHAFELGDTLIKSPPRVVAGVKDAISGVVTGVRTASPAIMAAGGETAAVAGRVGFRFLGGPWVAAAITLYDTKDYWYPFVVDAVQGAFGTVDPNGTVDSNPQVRTVAGMHLGGISTTSNTGGATQTGFTTTITNSSSTKNDVYWITQISCKNNSTGAITTTASGLGGVGQLANGVIQPINGLCPQYTSIIGAAVFPECSMVACAPGVVGHPGPENKATWGTLAPTGGGFNPLDPGVKYKVTSQCINASGERSSISAETSGDQGGLKVPSCGAAGLGHGTGGFSVTGLAPGGQPGEEKTLWDSGAGPFSDPATPLCDPGRVGSGCELSVTKDGQPCTTGDPECENWQENSQKDDQQKARYGCKLGPYTLPLSMCNLLARAYFPGGSIATDANIDGDPSTVNNLDVGGRTVEAPAPTITSTVPGGQGEPAPEAEPEAKQCFPGGWAVFNPMWIVDGLKCAFIPKTDIKVRIATLQAEANTKAPLSWFAVPIAGPSGAGCPNWQIHVGQASWSAVCDSSFTAAIVGSRGLIFAMLSAAMVWPLIRSLWYAAIPILRVTPSSGGK